MPRRTRGPNGDLPVHVLNRAVRRAVLFRVPADYFAFERVLRQGLTRVPVRLLAYCAMPTHFHLIVWPTSTLQLSRFMQWFSGTHAHRWHAAHGTLGTGPVYQGRFKAVVIGSDRHLLWACRYVERNPVRAGLVDRAEDWRWSSLWHRDHPTHGLDLSDWPVPRPVDWTAYVNQPQTSAEMAALAEFAIVRQPRGRPPVTSRGPETINYPDPFHT